MNDLLDRVPLNVAPRIRERLARLLHWDSRLRGVGYTSFLEAAMDAYEAGKWTVPTDEPDSAQLRQEAATAAGRDRA